MVARKATTRKSTKVSEHENAAVLAAAEELTQDKITDQFGEFRNAMTDVSSTLEAGLRIQRKEFEDLTKAKVLAVQRLKDLEVVESEAVTIDEIRQQRIEDEAAHDKAISELEEDYASKQLVRDQEHTRALEEANYAAEQVRSRLRTSQAAEIQDHKRNESIRQQDLERAWSDREEALKAQETEVSELRDKVAGFDELLSGKIAEAQKKAIAEITKNQEHELALVTQRADSFTALMKSKLTSAEDVAENREEVIETLHKEIAGLRGDMKDVTKAALDAQSGQQALRAVREQTTAESGKSGGRR